MKDVSNIIVVIWTENDLSYIYRDKSQECGKMSVVWKACMTAVGWLKLASLRWSRTKPPQIYAHYRCYNIAIHILRTPRIASMIIYKYVRMTRSLTILLCIWSIPTNCRGANPGIPLFRPEASMLSEMNGPRKARSIMPYDIANLYFNSLSCKINLSIYSLFVTRSKQRNLSIQKLFSGLWSFQIN